MDIMNGLNICIKIIIPTRSNAGYEIILCTSTFLLVGRQIIARVGDAVRVNYMMKTFKATAGSYVVL